jgi:hypothetical protein
VIKIISHIFWWRPLPHMAKSAVHKIIVFKVDGWWIGQSGGTLRTNHDITAKSKEWYSFA